MLIKVLFLVIGSLLCGYDTLYARVSFDFGVSICTRNSIWYIKNRVLAFCSVFHFPLEICCTDSRVLRKTQGKVCVHFILFRLYLWDVIGYVVVVVITRCDIVIQRRWRKSQERSTFKSLIKCANARQHVYGKIVGTCVDTFVWTDMYSWYMCCCDTTCLW